MIYNASPIFDLNDESVFACFNALEIEIPPLYDKLYRSSVARKNMRTASLFNKSAFSNLECIRYIEPKLFDKLVERFPNLEFAANYSNGGYLNQINKLNPGKMSWREYALYLIDQCKDEEKKEIWKSKIISVILGVAYTDQHIMRRTKLALDILLELDSDFTEKVVNDHYEEDEMFISNKVIETNRRNVVAIGHLPMESVTKEVQDIIIYVVENNLINSFYDSTLLGKQLKHFERYDSKTLWTERKEQIALGGSNRAKKKMKVKEKEQLYENVILYKDIKNEDELKIWKKRVINGTKIYFAENLQDLFNWKLVAKLISDGDVVMKELNFKN